MINDKDDLEKVELHKLFIRLAKVHRRKTHEEFTKVGLTEGQPKILDYLALNNGCIQRELASNCHIEPATVTSILTSMEKLQLIYRIQSPEDKRVLKVFLTDKGKEKQKQVREIFKNVDKKCFEGFSDMEQLEAKIVLKRLYDNLVKVEGE